MTEALSQSDVCILGGCGRVGLPLGLAFARSGLDTVLYDVNEEAVAAVNRGQMPYMERGADKVLRATIGTKLQATTSPDAISSADAVVIVIGTPVDRHLNPDFAAMLRLISSVEEYFRDGQLIVLRSTVFPGTTEKINRYLKEAGIQVHLSFCPERIAEGHALVELVELPHIVSGVSEEAVKKAAGLFKSLGSETIILKPIEAELAKLFTNSWRYIEFSIANQFYMIADEYGLDFYRIYDAMTYKYPRAKDFPRPGFAAGPCLFKDTMQLAAFHQNHFFLGHAAMLVNEGLPNHLVRTMEKRYPLQNMTVGILGMAFKANIDDSRDSLSYKLMKVLETTAARVLCSDPYIENSKFVDFEELVKQSDIIVLGVPHSEYLAKAQLLKTKTVIDVWNALNGG